MVSMVRGSLGCHRKIRKSEKVWDFYIPKSGKNKRVGESQEKSKFYGVKVNKDAEKILNCFMQTAYNSSQIFSALFSYTLFVFTLLNYFCRLCF